MKKKQGARLPLIDTHAHLTFPEFEKDRDEVLKRAWDVGLEAIIVIGAGAGFEGNVEVLDYVKGKEGLYATVGIHPHDSERVDLDRTVKDLGKLAGNEKVVAIGEIGLDYYRKHSSRDSQLNCFKRLLELSFELKLPISIHDRDAHRDTLFTLREYRSELNGGIFHCFSGDVDMAHEVIELGFYIAIPGVVSFKNAGELKEVVREIPIEKFVLETDCPYLAPVPHRGKRNEPAYVLHIAEEIAKIKGLSVEDVARITTINARRAYQLSGFIPEGKIAYSIRKSLYINLTNRCTLACVFCPKRSGNFEVKGHNLKLKREPSVEDIFRAVGDVRGYEEVVFCGFGEPTLRLEVLKAVAGGLKEKGAKIRIDTDGLGNLVHNRNILPELEGLVDSVSVSLNAPTPEDYVKCCPSRYGERAFDAVIDFIKQSKKYIPDVVATAVTIPGIDVNKCKKITKEIGVKFRARTHQEVG